MTPSLYTERDVQDLWERQRFVRDGLLTEDARRLVVGFPGWRSGEGGPDFQGARLRLDGVEVRGDVEIHLTPSGWRAHGHDRRGAYAAVVLHVVLRRDPFVEPPRDLPLLVLEPYLHSTPAPAEFSAEDDLDRQGDAWYAERKAALRRAVERAGADETLYREILVALGYKHNKAAMAELARRRPLSSLPADAGSIEARLREAAAEMPREMWRLKNVRPANHPWRRLSGMARFLAAAREEGLARALAARSAVEEMVAWLDPDGTGLIGTQRAREIALNVLVPFLGDAAWRRAAGSPPPPLPPLLRTALGRCSGGQGGAAVEEVRTVRAYFGALRRLKRGVFSLARPSGEC